MFIVLFKGMLRKTHLAIGLAASLLFMSYVNDEAIFLVVVLIASLLPDIDHGFSSIGKGFIFKPIQMMTDHRGILHTYTFCVGVTILFTLFLPVVALPFFVGYSFHLFADSFTVQGIKPFWPFKAISKGVVRTGGNVDNMIFFIFVIINFVLLGLTAFRIFS